MLDAFLGLSSKVPSSRIHESAHLGIKYNLLVSEKGELRLQVLAVGLQKWCKNYAWKQEVVLGAAGWRKLPLLVILGRKGLFSCYVVQDTGKMSRYRAFLQEEFLSLKDDTCHFERPPLGALCGLSFLLLVSSPGGLEMDNSWVIFFAHPFS